MKKISFKAKITVWITLLITAVCAVSIAGTLLLSRGVAKKELQNSLIAAVEKNADEIEYKNGILEIENEFLFYSDGIYCDVYNENLEYINGRIPEGLIDTEEFSNEALKTHSNEQGMYYIYDICMNFQKYEYEIDVFSGQIIRYEADFSLSEVTECDYKITQFDGGISTEDAIDIALSHAGVSRENAKITSAQIPGYDNRQVFQIEFICNEPMLGSVWIRGTVAADAAESAFVAINQSLIYIIPVFILIAALGAYFLSKRTIRPVEDITRSAAKISSGNDLSKRIETDGGSNEISLLAQTFNDMLERLQSSFESEKRFTSDASHELRTPLAVIKAECEYALSQNADREDKEEALSSINEQTDKMTALVNALLSLARTEQGARRFHFESLNLSSTVRDICSEFVLSKGITLTAEISEGIFFDADASLIDLLLKNLLSNAVSYGKENGSIKVKLTENDGKIVLSVKDNGIGIKEDDLKRIWSRFYRAESSRNSGGFGLGLALVDRITSLHGGKAEANSVFGEGSEFIITFFKKI